jgi:proline racemase
MKISRVFSSIDTHTSGQPTRTITGGIPYIPGKTIVEKMLYLKKNMDWIRTALMFEPRGHAIMSGAILTEPTDPDADIGVIFIETTGYLPMCGHDTIGLGTALVETGMVQVKEPLTTIVMDTPAGLTRVRVDVENGKAKSVTFKNIPSFVMAADAVVDVPGLGKITMDVAYGGNVYAILAAEAVGLEIRPENAGKAIELGRKIKQAVNDQVPIQHPEKEFINECTHVEFYGPPKSPAAHLQNTVFFAESGIDRSPCGTGTSAKLAVLHQKGQMKLNQEFVHESIIGGIFRARIVETTTVGSLPAVVPEVSGTAKIMGMNQLFIDPDDDLKYGFLLS